MSRFIFTIFAVLASLCVFVIARPVERQVGNLQCNLARLAIVSNLSKTNKAVGAIDTTDAAVASAVTAAQTGLDGADAGIKTIATSLFSGKAADPAARDQVGKGLTDAMTALNGIANSTDTNVAAAVKSLTKAIGNGQDVVSTCK